MHHDQEGCNDVHEYHVRVITILTTNDEPRCFREMNGKTVVHNMTFNNYGMVVNGKILGTDLIFSEVFKRVTPEISGYYIFESEVG